MALPCRGGAGVGVQKLLNGVGSSARDCGPQGASVHHHGYGRRNYDSKSSALMNFKISLMIPPRRIVAPVRSHCSYMLNPKEMLHLELSVEADAMKISAWGCC